MKNRVCLLVFFLSMSSCGHMFYYPDAYMHFDRDKFTTYLQGSKWQEDTWQGPYGKIIAWTFKSAKESLATNKIHILFFHGNAENVSSHFYSLLWILEQGYSYTIFDYPGYGGSEGEPSQKSTTEVGHFVLDKLHKIFPDTTFLIFGQSLGGNIALYTAAERPPDYRICGTVIESSFLSYKTVARRVLSRHWSTWLFQPLSYVLIRDSYSAQNNIQKLSPIPLLVLHNPSDPIVGFENGQDIFDAAPQPKEFVVTENSGHAGAFVGEDRTKFQNLFLNFIRKNCQNYKNH